MSYKKATIIVESLHDSPHLQEVSEHLRAHFLIVPAVYGMDDELPTESNRITLLMLSDSEIKQFVKKLYHHPLSLNLAIIPNEHAPLAIRSYGVSKDLFEAIDDAFNPKLMTQTDLLFCNEEVVFNRVYVGDLHGLDRVPSLSFWQKVKTVLSNLGEIRFKSVTLTVGDDHVIQSAVSGVMVLEHSLTPHTNLTNESLSLHDGKLNAFVLSPTSLLAYFYYLLLIIFYRRISIVNLPKSLGLIRSSRLLLESPSSFDFVVDEVHLSAKSVELKVDKDALSIHLGRRLESLVKADDSSEQKDTIKVSALPKGEMKSLIIDGKLPLFPKAADEEFKELFTSLRESAKLGSIFITLMILSTLLATTGLFQNSAPVIIGAMILAPLMAPIISLSMGIIRVDSDLIRNSLFTLGIGISLAILVAFTATLIFPIEVLTSEIKARANPNTLDLLVAIFSGIAGAYANSKSEVAKSLAGVAIAVALVPPLSVIGIGLGWGEVSVALGSFLLFITNLVGITLAAAVTFIFLGYSPIKRAKKGIITVSVLLTLISIPLSFSFYDMIERSSDFAKLNQTQRMQLGELTVQINVIRVKSSNSDSATVEVEVVSDEILHKAGYQELKSKLEAQLGKSLTLEVKPKLIVR
jgi:uncharacterized hydrophobic protein (TIGR00271 family)